MNKSLALFALAAVATAHGGHNGAYGHSHNNSYGGVQRSYGQQGGNSFARGFGGLESSRGFGGYGGYNRYSGNAGYDSDGPRRSRFDKDSETYGHENGAHFGTEFGEKDNHGGDDRDYGYQVSGNRGYGYGRQHQELSRDVNRRSYGDNRSFGGYGRRYGGYAYDSDGPRQSRFDKDSETYGHENGAHQGTEFGEKDNHGGDDPREYGYQTRGYGYGQQHQELSRDVNRRSYGDNRGFGGYGRRYGGYAYDSDGPRQSRFDKDSETYGHENGPHQNTEFGEKDNHGGDDRDYGYQNRGYNTRRGRGNYGW